MSAIRILIFTALATKVSSYKNLARSASLWSENSAPYDSYSSLSALTDGVVTFCNEY